MLLHDVALAVYVVLLIYFFVLWARFILDVARSISRSWRPRGLALVLAELVFTLTDPPLNLVRKVVPAIRIGGAALDFAWSIVMLVLIILLYVALLFA